MIAFIDDHRDAHGVEPICRVLPIAPSTYHAHLARRADPEKAPARVRRDTELCGKVRRVFEENFQVYGVRKGELPNCLLSSDCLPVELLSHGVPGLIFESLR
jgi:hypothetical protein